MSAEKWYCYFSYRAEFQGPCRIDVRTNGGRSGWSIYASGRSRVSWSAAWAGNGAFYTPYRCTDTLVNVYVMEPERTRYKLGSNGLYLPVDSSTFATFPALNSTAATDSFTVTACYCPNFDSVEDIGGTTCDSAFEFIQPVGAMYYWMMRLCDEASFMTCGVLSEAYMRLMPQQPAVLRLQCPPGGVCQGDTDNKLKFLPAQTNMDEEEPSWHPLHRCRQWDAQEATNLTWMKSDASVLVTGGTRRDYKVWQSTPLLVTKSFGEIFDVCYCDVECDNPLNFFKVGMLQTAEHIGIARYHRKVSVLDLVPPLETIKYVGKSGSLTLFAGVSSPLTAAMRPYDSVPFTRTGLVKLVSFDRDELYLPNGATPAPSPVGGPPAPPPANMATLEESLGLNKRQVPDTQPGLDRACQGPYYGDLTAGPMSAAMALEFQAYVGPSDVLQYYSFSGVDRDQTFPAVKSGILSVCYCAMLDDVTTGLCADDKYWIHATRLMIVGPEGGTTVTLPTNFVVRIELDGWGFTSTDSLRTISLAQACDENDFSPLGKFEFKVGCPGVNSSSCQFPSRDDHVSAYVEGSDTTGVYITELLIGEENSTLRFSGNIVDHLKEGDSITIDESTVLFDNRRNGSWSEAERFEVGKLTGFIAYPDDPNTTRMMTRKVSYIYRSGGQRYPDRLGINVGWPEGKQPYITFVNNQGIWSQRNLLRTAEEIYSEDPTLLKLCWGVKEGGTQRYYGEAGLLEFVDPETMADAGIHFTSQMEDSIAPVVVTFSPTVGLREYRDLTEPIVLRILFRDLAGKLEPLLTGAPGAPPATLDPEIELSMEDATQAMCGLLFAEMWTNDVGGFPFVRGCYYGRMYQDKPTVPGQEPPGGYRDYFIVFEPKQGLKSYCFDARTRAIGACAYQLVFNARVKQVRDTNRDVVSLYTMCGSKGEGSSCGGRYSVIEYGPGKPSFRTYPTNTSGTQLERVELHRHGGLVNGKLQTEDFEVLAERQLPTGERFSTLELKAYAANASLPIKRGSRLRLFFLPLTVWNFQLDACKATCIPPGNLSCSDNRGGTNVICSKDPVVFTRYDVKVRMPRNLIDMQYPIGMDELPANMSETVQLLKFTEIDLPEQGFFPQRFLAQLMDMDRTNPSVVDTYQVIHHVPQPGTTTGRLLQSGQAGCGPRPFGGDRDNELMLRLTLGFTLLNYEIPPFVLPEYEYSENETSTTTTSTTTGHPESPPKIEILLPPGYYCYPLGVADPEGQEEYFKQDSNGDGYLDNYKGTLESLGSWTSTGPNCTFTLTDHAAVYAGQIFYFRIKVTNPWTVLLRDDPRNIWYISARGVNGLDVQGRVPFISLEEEKLLRGWVGNLAVLTPIRGASIQPTSFLPSATNHLHIFFQAMTWMPAGSHVVVDGPDNFDFFADCTVADLDEEYYSKYYSLPWGEGQLGPESALRRLGTPQSCTGDQWKRGMFDPPATSLFNRAKIKVSVDLEPGAYYGFKIEVKNAFSYELAQHETWRLWIQSPEGYPVDGSQMTVPFSGSRADKLVESPFEKSWALYSAEFVDVKLDFGSGAFAFPTSVEIIHTLIQVFPLQAVESTVANLRITAPYGYKWLINATDGFIGQIPGKTCGELECLIYSKPHVSAYYSQNELILPGIVLRYGTVYGFQARMHVPDRPPTRSTNAFYFELGYDGDDLEERRQAGILPPPMIKAVYEASVFSLCTGMAYRENSVEFHLRTVTALGRNEGFVIMGDAATFLTLIECFPRTSPGKLGLPPDGQCTIFEDPISKLPVVILSVTEEPMPAGHYGFAFDGVNNPFALSQSYAHWTMGTFADVHRYPALKVIDKAAVVPGVRNVEWMEDADFLEMPEWEAANMSRDDRPGLPNRLIFHFRLYAEQRFPPNEPTIAIRGPYGFVFDENCSLQLQPITNDTFGGSEATNTTNATNATPVWPCTVEPLASWCPTKIHPWPKGKTPTGCLGLGRTAKVSLPRGAGIFEPEKTYAFEIGVTNAPDGNEDDRWAIDFGDVASKPFHSFKVRTFDVSLSSMLVVSKVVSPGLRTDIGTPVSIDFVPTQLVPAGQPIEGQLVLEAPMGFAFDTALNPDRCHRTILEVADRDPGDTYALFTTGGFLRGADTDCFVFNSTRITFHFIDKKPLQARVRYRLTVMVRNPTVPQKAAPWELLTFKYNRDTFQRIPLDRIVFPGYQVSLGIQKWLVINDSDEHLGGYKVRTTTLAVEFGSNVMTRQSLLITPPPGVDLRSTDPAPPPGGCNNFRWPGVVVPLPDSPPPECICNMELQVGTGEEVLRCTMRLRIEEPRSNRGVALKQGDELRWNISMINPPGPPSVVDNYWHVQQLSASDSVISSASTPGWDVYGLVRNISLISIGAQQRADAMNDLQVQFMPTVHAFVLELILSEPSGFDFSQARFEPPFRRDDRSKGPRVIVIGGQFPAMQLTSMNILMVRNGAPGGGTRLSIRLYNDVALQDQTGRRDHFIRGFRLAGALEVHDHRLWSETVVAHHEGTVANHDVVVPLLPPYATEPTGQPFLSRVEMLFTVTMNTSMGHRLVVTSFGDEELEEVPFQPYIEPGYEPELILCENTYSKAPVNPYGPSGYSEVAPMPCTQLEKMHFLEMNLLRDDGFPYALNATFNRSIKSHGHAVEAGRLYSLRFWVKASVSWPYWRLDIFDDLRTPLNTNDGLLRSVRAVARMHMDIILPSNRIPPKSVVDVDLFVRAGEGQQDFTAVEVALPPGIAPWGMGLTSEPNGTKRLVARIDIDLVAMQEIKDGGKTFGLRLFTPSVSSSDLRWFAMSKLLIEAELGSLEEDSMRMTGWGSVPGFEVAPLPVELRYAPVLNFDGWMGVTFHVPVLIKGTFVIVEAPGAYGLFCPIDETFLVGPCQPGGGQGSGASVNVTLLRGSRAGSSLVYSFLLGVRTPEALEQAGAPLWTVRVLNRIGYTLDAAIDIEKSPLVKGLFLQKPTLSWETPPQHGETSVVTIEITFDRRVEKIKAILITLPEMYAHDIQHRNQFKNLNRFFPVAIDIEWRNFENLGWVRILANDGVPPERDFLPAGTFQWQFPVLVPRRLPVNMEWYLSLCPDFSCQRPSDVEVNFPIPNTEPILEARAWGPMLATTAAAGRSYSALSPLLSLVMALFLASRSQKLL
eukprot:TRINITY_DN120761_c0_g1_i1.p1 TRINITY_DN120761_c0_g1~~TRINITY_DN120761_c0_g1_i1.p1  ORF type:complete len:3438 (+),score=820.13 TRINITY_DN120761_c0_g1_i1:922-10314(+)